MRCAARGTQRVVVLQQAGLKVAVDGQMPSASCHGQLLCFLSCILLDECSWVVIYTNRMLCGVVLRGINFPLFRHMGAVNAPSSSLGGACHGRPAMLRHGGRTHAHMCMCILHTPPSLPACLPARAWWHACMAAVWPAVCGRKPGAANRCGLPGQNQPLCSLTAQLGISSPHITSHHIS